MAKVWRVPIVSSYISFTNNASLWAYLIRRLSDEAYKDNKPTISRQGTAQVMLQIGSCQNKKNNKRQAIAAINERMYSIKSTFLKGNSRTGKVSREI